MQGNWGACFCSLEKGVKVTFGQKYFTVIICRLYFNIFTKNIKIKKNYFFPSFFSHGTPFASWERATLKCRKSAFHFKRARDIFWGMFLDHNDYFKLYLVTKLDYHVVRFPCQWFLIFEIVLQKSFSFCNLLFKKLRDLPYSPSFKIFYRRNSPG